MTAKRYREAGRKVEALGLVRDGSKSMDTSNVYEKGCRVTAACTLTRDGRPVSIFSKVQSSKEKDFTSVNDVTFSAILRKLFSMENGFRQHS